MYIDPLQSKYKIFAFCPRDRYIIDNNVCEKCLSKQKECRNDQGCLRAYNTYLLHFGLYIEDNSIYSISIVTLINDIDTIKREARDGYIRLSNKYLLYVGDNKLRLVSSDDVIELKRYFIESFNSTYEDWIQFAKFKILKGTYRIGDNPGYFDRFINAFCSGFYELREAL